MTDQIIDNYVKSYLLACLISGIHVEYDQASFLTNLVGHINSLEDRTYWADGDEDGVIIHDKYDLPVLALRYNGQTLKFTLFTSDDPNDHEFNTNAGLMLINIIGYIKELGIEHEPECMRVETVLIPPEQHAGQTIRPEDWSL